MHELLVLVSYNWVSFRLQVSDTQVCGVLPTLLMAQAVFSRILPLLVRRILEKSWRAARR